jgi:hypothetical protein
MKIIILLSLLLLTACSGFERTGYIDPEFILYVESFERYKGSEIRNMDIVFKDQEPPRVGICKYRGASRIIEIDPGYWERTSDYTKENLIFHELGHCDLGLGHTPMYGIMYDSILHPDFYEALRVVLIEMLFERGI